ncbi:MAG: hypothetical protein H0V37_09065 [Chloroflexia bacterium]|nr:hypothetical protein [Chloroflexia bacterium]
MTARPESRIDHATTGTTSVSHWRAVLRGLGDGSLGSALTVSPVTGAGPEDAAADAQPGIGAWSATDSEAGTRITSGPADAIGAPDAGISAS